MVIPPPAQGGDKGIEGADWSSHFAVLPVFEGRFGKDGCLSSLQAAD